jgi:hydrogenase maturation protease
MDYLPQWLNPQCHRICLAGVGNPDWGDDGCGCHLARRLQERCLGHPPESSRVDTGRLTIIDAGTTPENWLAALAGEGFDRWLWLDAVDMKCQPGAAAFLASPQIASQFPQLSTHKIALSTLTQLVESGGITTVGLLAIQPANLTWGANLSPTVSTTVEALADLMAAALALPTGSGSQRPPPPSRIEADDPSNKMLHPEAALAALAAKPTAGGCPC